MAELQAQCIVKFNRQAEENRRCLENQLAGEGTYGALDRNGVLLGTTTGTFRG